MVRGVALTVGGVEQGVPVVPATACGEVASPAHQVVFEFVPVGVVAGGEGFADAGRAVAQADVVVPAAGVGELGETPVFLGDDERLRVRR